MQILSVFLKLQAAKQNGPAFLAYPVIGGTEVTAFIYFLLCFALCCFQHIVCINS